MISVIIPVFNAEQYLQKCLESVKNQTFSEYECILVDDGSTDNSYNICASIAEGDSRFKTVRQQNMGASSARNTGILHAQGEYIAFIDADDYVTEVYLDDLAKDMDECVDLVIHGMIRVRQNGETVDRRMQSKGMYDLEHNYNTFFEDINIERYGGPVCKLFRTSIVKQMSYAFNTGIVLAEDLDFLVRYLLFCRGVRVSNKNNYIYREVDNSASSHLYSFERELNGMHCLNQSWRSLVGKYKTPRLYDIYGGSIAYLVYRCLFSIYVGRSTRKERLHNYKRIDEEYKSLYKKYRKPQGMILKVVKTLFDSRLYSPLDLLMSYIMRRNTAK